MIKELGVIGAVLLPLSNIPLILRIARRKSAADMSLWWTFGVWGCLWLMLPSGLQSVDPVFRAFTLTNLALFTGVVVQVLRYR